MKYRIVRDSFSGFQAQGYFGWFRGWQELSDGRRNWNTNKSIQEARDVCDRHAKRELSGTVVETYIPHAHKTSMKYRIVRDCYKGFEAQYRVGWFSFWRMVDGCNTVGSVEEARKLCDRHAGTQAIGSVVEYYDPGMWENS